ncbi:hypothetical protein QE152_g37094, partial [Popillia japonica]
GLAANVIRFPTRQEQTQRAEYFLRSVDFQGSLGALMVVISQSINHQDGI